MCPTGSLLLVGGGLFNLSIKGKDYSTREKSFCKTSFHLRIDGAEKGQKQGRHERTQEDYRTSAKIRSKVENFGSVYETSDTQFSFIHNRYFEHTEIMTIYSTGQKF